MGEKSSVVVAVVSLGDSPRREGGGDPLGLNLADIDNKTKKNDEGVERTSVIVLGTLEVDEA